MKVFIAGHTGLVGSALVRRLTGHADIVTRSRSELDLRREDFVWWLLQRERPDHVYLAAAMVGGIQSNIDRPADMILDNLDIQTSVINACREMGVKRLCFLGSSCIYPRDCPQPIQEDYLLSGPLEESNRAYAVAKLAGVEMCRAYAAQHGLVSVCLMPCNLYGPHGFRGTQATHVVPMLIERFHRAKVQRDPCVTVWGSGRPMREFMHVDDLTDAAVHFMEHPDPPQIVNIGTGAEISIHGLATLIAEIVGYDGDIAFDHTKPDGTPRKVLDVSRASRAGWNATIGLTEGLERTYRWYLDNA